MNHFLIAMTAYLGILAFLGAAIYYWSLGRVGHNWRYWPCLGTEVVCYAITIPPAVVLVFAMDFAAGFAKGSGTTDALVALPALAYLGWLALCAFFARPLSAMLVSRGAIGFSTAFVANLILLAVAAVIVVALTLAPLALR